MRTATLVLVAYLLAVLVSSVWRLLPFIGTPVMIPDIVALTAAYLGLTARQGVAPAVGGAVVLGYLCDLVSGAPTGLFALAAGITCLLAHGVHRRLLVRGLAMTIGFSVFVGAMASLLVTVIRVMHGMPLAGGRVELTRIVGVAFATGVVGPLVLRLFRRVDAAFARTQRERDHALEGLVP